MGIESGIVARLNAIPALTALVSNRIYADVLPEGVTKPAIVYQLISKIPLHNLGSETGKFQARVQFTVIADSKASTISVSAALEDGLRRFRGVVDDITIHDSRLENMFDQAYDLRTDQTVRICDYFIFYE